MKTVEGAGRAVKVLFAAEDGSPDGVGESLWAEEVAPGRYRLRNIPFTVDDVSYGDIVFAEPIGGCLVVTGTSIRAGHSTFAVGERRDAEAGALKRAWTELEALGCGREGDGRGNFAVDVPPNVDVREVRRALGAGRRARLWRWAETGRGHFATGLFVRRRGG